MATSLEMPAGSTQKLLLVAGAADIGIALLHAACIIAGPALYRALGAGRMIVEMAQAGHWYPAILALLIAAILATCAVYAFAAAGTLPAPPLLKLGLAIIGTVFVVRGLALLPAYLAARNGATSLHVLGAGGSIRFWYYTSAASLILGTLHLGGLAGFRRHP